MKQLRGRKALITGAASGLGRHIALALAAEGVDIWILDIDEAALAKTVADLTALGVQAVGKRCDLTKPDEIDRALDTLKAEWGAVQILINNAGVAFYGPTETMTAAQWDWLMKINLLAPIQITRVLLPMMLDQEEAHVLNMCSIAGLVAGGRFAAYHTSKFGLVGFTNAIRAEFGRRGLGVTTMCPGPVQTNLYKNAVSGRADRAVPDPPKWICTTEETVARKTVKAIKRNHRQVLITPLAHLLFQVHRWAPWFIDLLNHAGRKNKQKKAASQPAVAAETRRAA